MSADPYSELVRLLFDHATHAGELDGAVHVELDDQGIRLRLEARLANGTIEALRFRARGCPHVIAAAEWFCRRLEGHPAADLLEFSISDLMQSLCIPVEKTGRILVIEDAARSLGHLIRNAAA